MNLADEKLSDMEQRQADFKGQKEGRDPGGAAFDTDDPCGRL